MGCIAETITMTLELVEFAGIEATRYWSLRRLLFIIPAGEASAALLPFFGACALQRWAWHVLGVQNPAALPPNVHGVWRLRGLEFVHHASR